MFKRRSAHRFFSFSQKPKISKPTNFIKLSGMGGIAEIPTTGSVIIKPAPGDQVFQNGNSAAVEGSGHEFKQSRTDQTAVDEVEDGPHTPPKPRDLHPLKSHPLTPSSDDDAAPPPPDFTRRGIHIPSRTR
jgi:hypothetical protein